MRDSTTVSVGSGGDLTRLAGKASCRRSLLGRCAIFELSVAVSARRRAEADSAIRCVDRGHAAPSIDANRG